MNQERESVLYIIRAVLAIIRDMLMIVLMVAIIYFGIAFAGAASELGDQLNSIPK